MNVLSFGEIVWDIIEEEEHLGGAPLNLAAHLAQLGYQSDLVSRVGADRRGGAALDAMKRIGVDASLVQVDPVHPTGYVDVFVDGQGNPDFTIHQQVAYDFISFEAPLRDWLGNDRFDVFTFGTLCQRNEVSRNTLRQTLDAVRAAHVFCDVNLRQDFYDRDIIAHSLQRSTIVKLNHAETVALSGLLFREELDESTFASRIQEEYSVGLVCVTKGAEGCTVYDGGHRVDCPGTKVQVADTLGAGDAFSASFL